MFIADMCRVLFLLLNQAEEEAAASKKEVSESRFHVLQSTILILFAVPAISSLLVFGRSAMAIPSNLMISRIMSGRKWLLANHAFISS